MAPATPEPWLEETADLAGYLCRCSSASRRRRGKALARRVLDAAAHRQGPAARAVERDAEEALAHASEERVAARWRLLGGLRTLAGGSTLFVLGLLLLGWAWETAARRYGSWLDIVAAGPSDRLASLATGLDVDGTMGRGTVRRYTIASTPESESPEVAHPPDPAPESPERRSREPATDAAARPPDLPLPASTEPAPAAPADPMALVATRILSTKAFSVGSASGEDSTEGATANADAETPPKRKWEPVDLNDFVAPPRAAVRTGPRAVVGGGSAERESLRRLRTGKDDASMVFRAPTRREDRKGLDEDAGPQTQVPHLWVGETEVTQRQYMEVMGMDLGAISGQWWQPAEALSWCEALAFANKLSERDRLDPAYRIEGDCEHGGSVRWERSAGGYRLPSEDEWERLVSNAGQDARAVPGGANDRGIAPVHADVGDEVEGLIGLTDNAAEWVWGRGGGADPLVHRPGAGRAVARSCLEGAAEQVANYTVEALPCRLVADTADHRLGVGFRLVKPKEPGG